MGSLESQQKTPDTVAVLMEPISWRSSTASESYDPTQADGEREKTTTRFFDGGSTFT